VRAALSRAVPFVAVLAAAVPAAATAAPAAEPGERMLDRGDDARAQQDLGMRPSDAPGGGTPLPGAQRGGPADDAGAGAYPIDGPHHYGEGFGARGGSHQGQDVMADCGTPLRAVRDATVRRVATEAAAGRYVVLHDPDSGADYVYMHMSAVDVASGDRLRSGERVGEVGRTGDATACHLHFERWTGPGWYAGGHAKDPLPFLRSLTAS
jgi:murein DD-endopeptidase MepM/ murein hydrolase activator NlpD